MRPASLRFIRMASLCLCLVCAMVSIKAAQRTSTVSWSPRNDRGLLANGGFEQSASGTCTGWMPFEMGYTPDSDTSHTGRGSIRCANTRNEDRRGAHATIALNQRGAQPIVVEGWSKALGVGGFRNNDYSVYVDLEHTDGTPLWGQTAPFSVGTHGWEKQRVLILPSKPVRRLHVYALFRHHVGTVWFDDFAVRELRPGETFDGQEQGAPVLPAGRRWGWFAKDIQAGSPMRFVADERGTNAAAARIMGLSVRTAPSAAGRRSLWMEDVTGQDRCLTVYYAERIPDRPVRWWHDIRRSTPCSGAREYADLTRVGVGANGSISLYPFACVTGKGLGRAVGLVPSDGPRVARLGYHAATRLLYAAFDVALIPDRVRNTHKGRGSAGLQVVSFSTDQNWGFRSAASRYYAMFPDAYRRRALLDGIWIPFADPSSVDNVADFGVAYHEGDNSVVDDDRLGILSFHYTEPMTWWMPMDPSLPRDYSTALAEVKRHLSSSNEHLRSLAQAVMNSGSHDVTGAFNVEFQNAPWTNGAVWVLNPNPELPSPAGEKTKASLSYTRGDADRRYSMPAPAGLDGEYLDSIEGWADVLDYRRDSLRHSSVPVTFATDTLRPVVPTWFSVYELAKHMRDDLVRRGRLLMANYTPWRFHTFAPLLDVMGSEVNWMPGGVWRPDTDAAFCLRRTLSYRKPYLLLQNTDFDRFGSDRVEQYFRRCMFYGVFPSMFSVDAATKNYWTQPQWYNRDRALFRKYIPIIAELSRAGWEPITSAWTDNAEILLERYGSDHITVMNESSKVPTFTLKLDAGVFGGGAKSLVLKDMADGSEVTATPAGRRFEAKLSLHAVSVAAYRIVKRGTAEAVPRR